MSHRRLNSADSILSILSCPRKEFNEVYDGGYATDALVEDAKKIFCQNQVLLKQIGQDRYRLDELLLGMLDDAPDPSGQRYVAIVLHISLGKVGSNRCSQTMVGLFVPPES